MSSESNGRDDRVALQTLRQILLSEERTRLQAMEQQLQAGAMDAEQLAERLPEAISKASHRDEKLAQSLSTTITDALHTSIRQQPQALVDVIFPIIGPAIRRSIREAISGLVQSLNQTLEQSLSWQSLRWRWEARRSGRPFAEIVLLRTLTYQVEHVFLIHAPDGLLLQHVQATRPTEVDADLISGMLTAIQDFVRDSFGEDSSGGLKQLEVGERLIWVEAGPSATLAAVIFGHPPPALRTRFQEQLEAIHTQFRDELDEFQGDAASFEAAQPVLTECLVSARREAAPRPPWLKWLIAAVLVGLAASLILWGTFAFRTRSARMRLERIGRQLQSPPDVQWEWQRHQLVASGTAPDPWLRSARDLVRLLDDVPAIDWSGVQNRDQAWLDYLQRLTELPGIHVTQKKITDDGYEIAGFRDPLADDPATILEEFDVDPQRVHAAWQLIRLWDSPFRRQRVQRLLELPATVEWEWEEDVLRLRGSAPHAWLQQLPPRADMLAEFVQLDLSEVRDIEQEELTALLEEIRAASIGFLWGSPKAHRDQVAAVQRLAQQMSQAVTLSSQMGLPLRFTIVGTSWREEDDAPAELARTRARAIGTHLIQQDVPRELIVVTIDPPTSAPQLEDRSAPASFVRVAHP